MVPEYKRFIGVQKKQILHVYDTDYIVSGIFVNRESGMHMFLEDGKQFLISAVYIHKSHINAGYHHVSGRRISEVEYIVDHLLFFIFNDTVLFTDIHNGAQFMLCDCAGLGIGVNP